MANPNRKHRGDSKLKTLPEDLQAEIIVRMEAGKNKDVIAWLQSEWEVATSEGALSEFWSWWHLQQRMQIAQRTALDHQEWLKQAAPGMSAEDVLKAGNIVFMSAASAGNDPKVFEAMAKLFLRSQKDSANANFTREKIDLERRRIEVLEKKATTADAIEKATKGKPSSEMTEEERAAVLKVMDESFGVKSPA